MERRDGQHSEESETTLEECLILSVIRCFRNTPKAAKMVKTDVIQRVTHARKTMSVPLAIASRIARETK